MNDGLASEEVLAANLTGTNLSLNSTARNGYVKITGTGLGDTPIQTVTFTNNSGSNDGVSWDRLAYEIVPEPGSLALLAIGGLLVAKRRRRD